MRAWTPLALMICISATIVPAGGEQDARGNTMNTPTVWATGDGVRVNPVTGRYFEDQPEVHKDYPTGDYARSNPVWDAKAGKVTLRAARNEFAAFQLVVARPEGAGPLEGVQVRLDKLVGPGGAQITPPHVSLYKAWYVQVKQKSTRYDHLSLGPGWYADPLIPAPAGEPLRFDIPDARNAIGPSQRNQTVWVDIFVPPDRQAAPPGVYKGDLTVTCPAGSQTVAVELNVWDFALPDEIHCRGDIWNGTLKQMPPEQELGYYQMARRHRFQPGVCFYRPKLTVKGAEVTLDWTDYDARVGKYLDGTAFTKEHGYWGPGMGVPIGHMVLPFDCERGAKKSRAWPIPTPDGGPTPEFEAVWLETARQVKAHFEADPRMRKVEKILFIDSLDESYYQAAYDKMIYFCKLLRRGLGEGWFKYRIDGGYNSPAMRQLADYVDLWVCATIGFDQPKIQRFRDRVEPWFYGSVIYETTQSGGENGSNTLLDLDVLTGRCLGWIAWKYRCGYCAWEFDAHWIEGGPHRPLANWTEAINFRKGDAAFNGSGLLIYRGEFIGSDRPVASIRLKAHRRGFQDYEYFWLLKEAGEGPAADRIVNSIIHGQPLGWDAAGKTENWKNNPEAWDAARIEAGNMLDKMARKP
ncbi:MAG TPA: glycoside hydrolase domain-containing protein [Phycisphaerae bacterium]|nr:glycoside hydrolase domain-containing protein [Phycisphaerae bacterium]